MTPPNLLFERLRLQAHFRRVFDDLGQEQGWQLIRRAVELESLKYQTTRPDDDQQHQEIQPNGP